MKQPAIAVLGVFGAGNFGNEATLAAYLQALRARHPEAKIICLCYNTELVETTYGVAALPISGGPKKEPGPAKKTGLANRLENRLAQTSPGKILRTLLAIRDCDALVIPGTSILDDYGTPPGGLPWHLFRWCLAARLTGVPVSFIGIGAGPIVHPRSRRLMGWAARLARQRSYRDQNSKDFAQSIGVDTRHDPVIPDLAFHFAITNQQAYKNSPDRLHVGLGLMAYYGWRAHPAEGTGIFDEYLHRMARFTAWLLTEGHHVQLLIGELSDQQAIAKIYALLHQQLPANQLERLSSATQQTMDDLLRTIEPLDVVVTSRYHNIVGAFCRGIPVISIGYSPKCTAIMEDFSLGEFCQKIDKLDVDRLIAQFQNLAGRHSALRSSILDRALQHKNRLAQSVNPACLP